MEVRKRNQQNFHRFSKIFFENLLFCICFHSSCSFEQHPHSLNMFHQQRTSQRYYTNHLLHAITFPTEIENSEVLLQGFNIKRSTDTINEELWQAVGQLLIEVGAKSVESFEDYPGQYWATFSQDTDAEQQINFILNMCGIPHDNIFIEQTAVEAQEMWRDTSESNLFAPKICGKAQVLAVHDIQSEVDPSLVEIRILPGQAWGNGDHPTTSLCLEFISNHVDEKTETFLDYGCGSSVLSIAAIKLGAKKAFATDVCLDSLANAEQNLQTNGVSEQVDLFHPRTIVIGDLKTDVVVANILPGVLIRLRHTLALAVKPNGFLCLSGMRPTEVNAVKEAFQNYMDWDDSLTASGSHPKWGDWVRIVGRPKEGIKLDEAAVIEDLSETAVS
mmetsp:Transcript_7137/g.9563  ORF Transcript_7137/g.9563 Transcript_7137/m.9563 type:complete len:388 (+) Transcript_7137:60-1223(+)